MSRDLSSKCKRCRRAGEKLFLKGDRCNTPKCAVVRRAYAPGVHGAKSKRNISEYGQQLAMKQKIKRVYDVLERQFRRYFEEVRSKPGVTGDLLIQKLELRLDNVIYRSGLASNRRQSRQLVRHSHFLVNGKRMNVPSYEVRVGDILSIKKSKAEKNYFKMIEGIFRSGNVAGIPGWLDLDTEKKTVTVKSKPSRDDASLDLDAQMVVEYYSR